MEERLYGKLGETVYEKKTVATFTDPLHPSVFETRYHFETFGRLLRITYPDLEVVTNTYDSGGNLAKAEGVKAVAASGQNHRRLANLNAVRQGNNLFQNLQYSYDKVGNVRELQNQVAVPPPNVFGGPTVQHFDYDSLYRLTGAWGTFQYSPTKTHRYDQGSGKDR